MKKRICFLLALVLVLSLLAGCGAPSAEDQPAQDVPETTTQSPENDLPRTAEEMVPRLNEELKTRGIPVEFVYREESVYQMWKEEEESWVDVHFTQYLAAFTDSGTPVTTETFDLSVEYPDTPADPMTKLQIWVADDATQQEREMHRTVCAIAAELCDAQMTEETVGGLFAAEPAPTKYITNSGAVGSFTNQYDDSSYDHSVVFCQPANMTHTISRRLSSGEEWYEINFDQTWQTLFADKYLPSPSVDALERGINENLAAMGVPVECTLYPYCNYGSWKATFRFTTLDDPDYSYPQPNIENLETPEDIAAAYDNYFITVDLTVDALDPLSKDGPISGFDLTSNDHADWGEDYPVFCQALSQALMVAILRTCGAEDPDAELEALYAAKPTEDGYFMGGVPFRTLQKDQYTLELSDDNEGRKLFRVQYSYEPYMYYDLVESEKPQGEELLDPQLLVYDLQVEEPMVEDGYFNVYQTYSEYFGLKNNWRVDIGGAINDYLQYTRSEVSIDLDGENDSYRSYKIYAGYGNSEDCLLDHENYGLMIYGSNVGDYEVFLYYDTDVEEYCTTDYLTQLAPEKENILRIPIGISLLLDEGMTEEEAVQLHTHAMGYDYVGEDGVQITVYGPRDVVHILIENPETGNNNYFCMPRSWFDFAYGYLAEYLEN